MTGPIIRTRRAFASLIRAIPIGTVERTASGHFFEKGNMRFFRTHLPHVAYTGPGGTYFVTSEQFTSDGYQAPRRYTIRTQKPDRKIDTVGPFNKYSRAKATHIAQDLAAGVLDQDDVEEELS